MRLGLLVVSLLFSGSVACASVTKLYDGRSGAEATVEKVVETVQPGTVVIVSESHGFEPHHQNQRDFLIKVSETPHPISVGLEFLEYPEQKFVDQFLFDQITETEFLKLVKWGNPPFTHYRFQTRFPSYRNGKTLAINAPRDLTSKISKNGLKSLDKKDKALLPPDFKMGNGLYYDRFVEVMKHHVPQEKMQNYFEAQSTWDDTMAWTVSKFMKSHPDHVFVIIVGDFHAAYGGGLPDRLKARGLNDVLVISQVDATDTNKKEKRELLDPHPIYGPRSDFIWSIE